MLLRIFFCSLLLWSMDPGIANGHIIPTLVVEADFTDQRTVTLRVNLDPRLFLATQPTTLPPVPASWWFDQDANTQAESRKKGGDYIDHILAFRAGGTRIKGIWQISPIDSASAFPLETKSAEVHLLAEYTGPLPPTDGLFTLTLSPDCPVGLILVNRLESLDARKPQSLFAGETSVGFPLPAPVRAEAPPPSFIWLILLALPVLLLALKLRKRSH